MSQPVETASERAAFALRVERDLGVALGRARSLPDTLEAILDAALQLGEVDSGGVYLFDDAGNLVLANHRGLGADFVEETRFIPHGSPHIAPVCGGSPLFSTLQQIAPALTPVRRAEGIRAVGVVPVRDGDTTVAVLNVASHAVEAITPEIADAIVAMASRIGPLVERARSEAAVRASQENFQALFNSLDDFLFVLDERGSIIHVNTVVTERLGYGFDELVGRPVVDVHPPPRRAEAIQLVGEVLAGRASHCPVPLLTKDGREIEVETVVSRGRWNGKTAILRLSRDVTRRKAAVDALQVSESLHRTIVDHAPLGIARVDVSGRFVQSNAALQAMLGYAADQLEGLEFAEITHPDDIGPNVAHFRSVLRGETDAYHAEKRYLHRSGHVVWAEISVRAVRKGDGSVDFMLVLIADITARKELEAARAEAEREFRQMADAAPVLIWVTNERGQATFFNRTWHDFTGRTRVQELENGWREGIHPEDFERLRTDSMAHFAARTPMAREYRLRHADGTYRWVLERANPRWHSDGGFAGYVASCTDITERKHAETERERLLGELQNAMATVKTLGGLLPICAWCKKVRDDKGYWSRIEEFLRHHSDVVVSHGVCPDCIQHYFPEQAEALPADDE